jgi:hypothetical protein
MTRRSVAAVATADQADDSVQLDAAIDRAARALRRLLPRGTMITLLLAAPIRPPVLIADRKTLSEPRRP